MLSKNFPIVVLVLVACIAFSDAQLNPFSSIFEGMRRLVQRGMEVAKNLRKNLTNHTVSSKGTEKSDSSEGSIEDTKSKIPRDQSPGEEEESKLIDDSPFFVRKHY
jgi:hypothetical protein